MDLWRRGKPKVSRLEELLEAGQVKLNRCTAELQVWKPSVEEAKGFVELKKWCQRG